jgi:UDP-glucose 4-epimerase
MKVLVTGAAGFIGSNLCDRLLSQGHEVVGYDNLSTGQLRFLEQARSSGRFLLHEGDLLESSTLEEAMQGCDIVFHLAANADIKDGLNHPERDLQQNTVATFNVLEAMRQSSVKRIVFSSTGSVYGECDIIPTPENAPFPIQTSLYAASKVAGEGLIQAYCEGYGFQAWIFRFVSIMGERYSHGHVFDFYKQLLKDPSKLTVLGNGKQRKSYLHVSDCIDAVQLALREANDKINIFNLGTNEYCQVTDSISWISEYLGLAPVLNFTGGDRGWVGDNPFIFLDTTRIRSLGWTPKFTIKESVRSTIKFLQENQWLLETRH